jgi:hypothetical protein
MAKSFKILQAKMTPKARARSQALAEGLRTPKKFPVSELERLIEEATVDAYGESEGAGGFLTMLGENIELPFETNVLGATVNVIQFDIDDRDQIIAICEGGGQRQPIQLLNLPLPNPRPRGAEWIEAYRYWRREG